MRLRDCPEGTLLLLEALAKRNGGSVVKVETSFIEVAEDLPNEKSN